MLAPSLRVGILLVAAHEADHPPAGRALDHRREALAHQVLELHPLLDHGGAAPALYIMCEVFILAPTDLVDDHEITASGPATG